jgi:hypothetical protein
VTQAVAKVIVGHAKKGQLPVTLGGDHSLVCARVMCSPPIPTAHQAMGTISGVLE